MLVAELGKRVDEVEAELQAAKQELLKQERTLADQQDRENQRPAHVHIKPDVDNNDGCINIRPTGTSAAAALRRLRKDRPDIHARVLAGELTPHAGMVDGEHTGWQFLERETGTARGWHAQGSPAQVPPETQ